MHYKENCAPIGGMVYVIDIQRDKKGGWPEPGSNQRHKDFQSSALPTELSGPFQRLDTIWLWVFSSRQTFSKAEIHPNPQQYIRANLQAIALDNVEISRVNPPPILEQYSL